MNTKYCNCKEKRKINRDGYCTICKLPSKDIPISYGIINGCELLYFQGNLYSTKTKKRKKNENSR